MHHSDKKNKNGKKLSLSKETLRKLAESALSHVHGGGSQGCTITVTRGPTAECSNTHGN
jgi:hypothetical protein